MKKYAISLLLLAVLVIALPNAANAASDILKPTSVFYFAQGWGESLRLFFTFSKESKLEYLSHLNDKKISELQAYTQKDAKLSDELASGYEKNYDKIKKLALELPNKEQVAEKIKNQNLDQQATLARVYAQVPEAAKVGILNAQENSSKNVAAILEKALPEKVEEYVQKVQEIKRVQVLEKAGQVEKESGNGGGNPEGRGPKSLNSIKGGNELNDINSTNSGSENAQGRIQQAPMQSSASQQ